MTIQVVNGFVCMDCADVALANKDINPAHPPNSPNADAQSATRGNGQGTPAVTFGGSLTQLPGAQVVQQPGGTSQPQLNPDQANPTQTGQSQPYNPQNGEKLSVYA
jgi:hypothetical protein